MANHPVIEQENDQRGLFLQGGDEGIWVVQRRYLPHGNN
jgi:hypothetical protein